MSHRLAAFRSQCIFISFTTPMAMGTQLGFKRHRGSLLISMSPQAIVSTLLTVIIFTFRPLPPPTFTDVRDAQKQRQEYIYAST
jgi:hypothetical protein